MCGIIGAWGSSPAEKVAAAVRLLSHRGPDDQGAYTDPDMALSLGHVRLSIQDLSPLGHQPMLSEDQSVVLVFNGEIYNFHELRQELKEKGHRFRGNSDTEVLLQLYLAYGEAMLTRLNGIFAFALWDRRNRSLFIARDALGVKPLYYTENATGFAFASEMKALLYLAPQAPELRDLDIPALHRYLSFLWCPGEGTPLTAIRKVLPGEAMVVQHGRIERRWTWYQLPPFRGITPVLNKKTALQGTETLLRQAVHRQMVADVPVGAFLSGGLDSSAIVAFAREHNPKIQCFTIEAEGGQEDGDTDDLPYARRVARHLGVSLEVVKIDANRMAGDLERMVWQLDEPLADPAPLNVLYISELARQQGIKVLLSGVGGDDLFTGYRRHRAIQAESYKSWLPMAARSGLERATVALNQRNPIVRRMAKLFSGAGLSGDARLAHYFVWAKEPELLQLYTREFKARLAGAAATAPMLDFLRPLSDSVQPLERMLTLEQRFFLADHNLLYTDKMSMAVGVEVRVPFLDLDLVDFAARIPLDMKQRGRHGKWILKKAMEPYLPHDVIYRRKSGFGAPLRRWMRHELRELLGDLLSVDSLKKRGLFEPAAVQGLIDANDSGKLDAAYTLLSLLCIEIWCRRFIDGGEFPSVTLKQ